MYLAFRYQHNVVQNDLLESFYPDDGPSHMAIPHRATARKIGDKAMDMRRQGFFGAAMLPMSELEYTGIMEKLAVLEKRFAVRTLKKAA
jgi:fructose 1,6-bisphosphatase